jgi:hypothetical protein
MQRPLWPTLIPLVLELLCVLKWTLCSHCGSSTWSYFECRVDVVVCSISLGLQRSGLNTIAQAL